MYHLAEMETARRWNIPTITVVNNNSRLAQGWRNITVSHRGIPGRLEDLCAFEDLDYAKIAESFGCLGIRVEKPGDIRAALETALKSKRPTIINVVSTPEAHPDLPWTPSR